MEIEYHDHFSHSHSLVLNQQKHYEPVCNGCEMRITDNFYGCKRCDYNICRSCYKLPRKISHPFHRMDHPLALLAQSPYKFDIAACNACSKVCEGFIYHCSECKFDIDLNCAMLLPITTNNKNNHYYDRNYTGVVHEEEKEHQMITHPHRLIPCSYGKNYKEVDFPCSVCHLPIPIKGIIYVCLTCRSIMDKSCAQLPLQITHHFHPHHSLKLENCVYVGHSVCNACQDFSGHFLYNCSECQFSLDARCASLMPKPIDENQLDLAETEPLTLTFTFAQSRDLIPCYSNANFSFHCSACDMSIETTVYVCVKWGLLLHKWCAELPPKIKHPFHPSHFLVLSSDNMYDSFLCKACKCSVWGFKYWCAKCDFVVDVACASQNFSTSKFELHHHPLALFNMIKHKNASQNVCICGNRHGLGSPFFRCVQCDFSLNLCCHPTLPQRVRHDCHNRHPLVLTHSPIKDNSDDDSDSEYYCDLCEKRRAFRDSTYYCEECHYVAHIGCLFDEIHPLLERERSMTQDEKILLLQAEKNELTTGLETLLTNLDELKERHAHHIDYQVGVVEVIMKIASTNMTAFLRASRDNRIIVDADKEIIMLQAEVDAQTANLEILITKLDKLKEKRAQQVIHYEIGVMKVETDNGWRDKNVLSSATRDDLTIAKANEELIMLQTEIDALTAKLETVTTNLDELKERREHHLEGIPSLGKKLSLALLVDCEEMDEEECNVESMKNEEENEENDGTFTTLAELDKEIEAITAKLEALKKNRERRLSSLELK